MKTWKQFAFVAILTALGILVGFVACDNGQEEPEALNEQITLTFGENGPYTATVKGPEMLSEDRAKAVDNVIAMFESAYEDTNSNNFKNAFMFNNVIITLKNSTEYESWKTFGNENYYDLHLNLDKVVENDDDLKGNLRDALGKLISGTAGFAKAVPVRDGKNAPFGA